MICVCRPRRAARFRGAPIRRSALSARPMAPCGCSPSVTAAGPAWWPPAGRRVTRTRVLNRLRRGGLGFGEGPVERGDGGVLAGVLARLDDQFPGDLGDGGALVLEGDGEGEHVVVDDLGPPAVVAFGRGCGLALQGFSRM